MISQLFCLDNIKTINEISELYLIENINFDFYDYALEIRNINYLLEKLNKFLLQYQKINYFINDKKNILFLGSLKELNDLNNDLCSNDNFSEISESIQKTINKFLNYDTIKYQIGNKEFIFNQPYIMGILNVTSDSFSDGGIYLDKHKAVEYALEMLNDGADIIDIGGESSRPGSEPISEEEELDRTIPVIKEILNIKKDAIISIDTTKSKVAFESLNNGVQFVNDISGGTFDKNMFKVVSDFDAAFVIMHIQGTPKNMQQNPHYENLISEIYDFFNQQIFIASKFGIKKIFIDPGIGFGKTISHNYKILERLSDFKSLGFPILIGTSRKSFLGNSLKLKINEREEATLITESFAVMKGTKIIRTHNVKNAFKLKNIYNNMKFNFQDV
ncbi:MAG: hypothetical protein STSR0008_07560 [Ignavibacterium sp.]